MSLYQGRLITGMKNLFQIRWTYNRGEAITGGTIKGILRYFTLSLDSVKPSQ